MWFVGRMGSRLQVYQPLERRMLSPSLELVRMSSLCLQTMASRGRRCPQARCVRLAICAPALNSRTMRPLADLAEALSSGHSAI